MTNALLGILAIALLWFVLPMLVTLGALASCLVVRALPGRRRAAQQRPTDVALDVHRIPAAHPGSVQFEARADQCTARVVA